MYSYSMRPQDIVVLLKVIGYKGAPWKNKDLAGSLFLSTAEISNSLERSTISGLIDSDKKKVRTQSLFEFLVHGLPYIFPERPGNIARGVPTAHSHPFMQNYFSTEQMYVWPDPEGTERGLAVRPLYPNAVNAAKCDDGLYLSLALLDVLRMGKAREKNIAIEELKRSISESSH